MEFTGRLTADAIVRTFSDEKSVTCFRIAIDQGYMHKGQWVDKPLFVDCEDWRRAALAPHLLKGVLVKVAGWLEHYVNEESGKARLICHLNELKLYGSTSVAKKPASAAQQAPAAEPLTDDLPF